MDNIPLVEFINSPRTELDRLKSTRKEVANEWFHNHGFIVVPELSRSVVATSQVIYPREFVYSKVDTTSYAKEWQQVEKKFWAELNHYLPEALATHSKIQVDVGWYGTVASSYWSSSHYYLRADRSVADLAAMIINHTLYDNRTKLGITWTKREALMDFIMTRPVMHKLFPKFEPIFSQLARIPAKVRTKSEEYVHSLGIVTKKPDYAILQGKIVIKGKLVGKELSKKEKVVLKLLIEHRGDLVTYDDLADEVWGVGEFKTYWALNKMVERVRNKLGEMAIESLEIESVRGQGYLLK